MWIEFVLILVASYLVGSVPMAFLIVKWIYKVDIRKIGTGGVGASNVWRNFSKPLGIAVGMYDAGKGALMVWIAHSLGFETPYLVAVGFAVVAGHNWPIFLRFNAGRGLSTTLGVIFFLFPFGIWVFVAGAIFTLLLGSSPLPTLIGVAAMPLTAWIRHEPVEVTLGLTALFLLLIFRRLTAPRSDRSRAISTRELLLNRFLFDRDIRDGKAWITVKPVSVRKSKEKRKI